jgi:hypothetical protein
MSQEGSADKSSVDLTSCGQIDTSKLAVDRKTQGGNMHLGQVYVRRSGAMDTRDRSPIDDGKAQVMANQIVNATLGRSGID